MPRTQLLRLACLVASYACTAHAGSPSPASVSAGRPGLEVVLVSGDRSLPVFDNAIDSMAALLASGGSERADIHRLSASSAAVRHGARSATLDHVLQAVATMRPAPGDGCLVYATSHGVEHEGLYLERRDEVLTAQALDRALLLGCGTAPTVVIVSSCFSGVFVQPPMNRPNRLVLTAARADRTSFGCQAGRTYTVYDRCLLDALHRDGTWKQAYAVIKDCVGAEELREDVMPSEPQAWFGDGVSDARLPGFVAAGRR